VKEKNNKWKKKIIKAEVTEIGEHHITFTPIIKISNKSFMLNSALKLLEFTTTGRVIVATTLPLSYCLFF
jgi:hypothetical protein